MNSAEVAPIRSWPGWSRGRRLAVTVARGALWLAAAHPGQADPTRSHPLPDPLEVAFRVAHEASGLNRPVIEVMAIQPVHVTLMPAQAAPAPGPADWLEVSDSDDPLFIYWPPRLPGAAVRDAWYRRSPVVTPHGPGPLLAGQLPADGSASSTADDEARIDDEFEVGEFEGVASDGEPVGLPIRTVLPEPNGGEVWSADSLATVRWQAEGGVDPLFIRLEFSVDDGRSWRLLADSLYNEGSWDWEVPWLEARRARLRVMARDDSGLVGVDAADRSFTIRKPEWIGMTPPPLLALDAGSRLSAGSFRLVVELAAATPVELVILAVTGRLVRRLMDGPMEAGGHVVEWDGRGENARPVASGIYFARLMALGDRLVRRLVLVRGRRRTGRRPGWWGMTLPRYTGDRRPA
ncbi:MAG TPA: FlgD immunoglobulin-like domain containing protein [Candidatus Eisenbacteria bacterium]